jgi:hypothetical protein
MRMKKITVRIQDETAEYLVSMPGYAISRAGEQLLDVVADWMIEAERNVISKFSLEEKRVVISLVDEWEILFLREVTPESLARKAIEHVSPGSRGFLLGLSEEGKKAMEKKIMSLAPQEAVAFVLWGMGFWEGRGKDVDEYCGKN